MRGYTGSQEAAQWSLSGARGSGMVSSDPLGAIYIYYKTDCQLTLLNGTLVVVRSPWVLVPGVVSSAT